MPKTILKLKSISSENMVKKLSISVFFMSIIPILFLIYLVHAVGFDAFSQKFPYLRWTISLVVCLVFVMFLFLRYSIKSIAYIKDIAKKIANGDYKQRIDIKEYDVDDAGQLAKSFNKITDELEARIMELEESKGLIQDIFKKIGAAITSIEGIEQLLGLITETIAKGVVAQGGCIMLLDKKAEELRMKVSYGIDEKSFKAKAIRLGEGPVGLSAKERRIITSAYVEGLEKTEGTTVQLYSKNIISVPLLFKEECVGVLAVFDKKTSPNFKEDDVMLISNIANQAAVAIVNANLNEDAEQTYIETITALAMAVEAKDPYSRGHLDRVARLVVKFAEHLGLTDKVKAILKDGAKLHDLGKIGVRDDILLKQTPLTEEEHKESEQHVIIGENIMRPIRRLAPLCDMVRYHQEWWNGEGYPDKLKGEEIPLTARILKIADAYDAMSTDRPYRKALPKQQIIQELKKSSGREFDPHLVEKFLELI